jgi:hypothetical protein
MKQEECYAKPKRVVQVGPEYPDAHNNLGLALSSIGKRFSENSAGAVHTIVL